MATFRFRANRWQARVRRKGNPDLTKTFVTRQDAERWARSAEVDLDRGSYVSPVEAQRITLGGLIDRYIREVLPAMKGAKEDGIRLAAMKRNSVAKLSLASLTPIVMRSGRSAAATLESTSTRVNGVGDALTAPRLLNTTVDAASVTRVMSPDEPSPAVRLCMMAGQALLTVSQPTNQAAPSLNTNCTDTFLLTASARATCKPF